MHPTQIFILTQLTDSDGLRYTDMRPPTMEASKFMYHLKSLMNAGFVTKTDKLYALTSKGTQFVDRFDEVNLAPINHPRVTISLLYKHSQNGTLLLHRDQHPARGGIGFVICDVPIDYATPLETFAKQSFTDFTGIKTTFKHVGDGYYVRLLRNGSLDGNMLTHVMIANGEKLPTTNHRFAWENDTHNEPVLSSVNYILDLVKSEQNHFFFEYEMSFGS